MSHFFYFKCKANTISLEQSRGRIVNQWTDGAFTLWSMTPVYPSSAAAANPLLGFSVDRTGGPSKRREADAEEDEEGESLRPELLLYTNIKLAAVVMRMMPPTPWHWRIHMGQGEKKKRKNKFKQTLKSSMEPVMKTSVLLLIGCNRILRDASTSCESWDQIQRAQHAQMRRKRTENHCLF